MNARTREEEYLRRMKALGYEPSLAGMDDGDIEWELSKMDEAAKRHAAAVEQPLRTVYRPVDPGLKARILRMFGQPHDASAIPKGQEFYLNGWDNGEDDYRLQKKPAPGMLNPLSGGTRRPEEPLNYWDTVLNGSREGGARNWFQPASWVSSDVKAPTNPKPDFTYPLSPKNIIWREEEKPQKNTPPDPLPEGTFITSNDAGSNAGMIEEAKNYPDVTEKLKSLMAEYEEKFKDIKDKPIFDRLKTFYELVDDGAILDLKRQPGWESPKFVYKGEVVNNDVPGNILFGYLGKHFDIPDTVLHLGAGSNQMKNDIKAALEEGRNPLEVLKNFNFDTFGDDPRDTTRIRQGIEKWNKKYPPKELLFYGD